MSAENTENVDIEDRVIFKIFSVIDDLCWKNDWDTINGMLRDCDPTKVKLSEALAYLTIAKCVRSKCSEFDLLLERFRKHILATEPARERLLLAHFDI